MLALLLLVPTEVVIDGKVTAVRDGVVSVQRANGKVTDVKVDKRTEVRLDGRVRDTGAIRVGQDVRCVFDLDTQHASHFGIYVVLDPPTRR